MNMSSLYRLALVAAAVMSMNLPLTARAQAAPAQVQGSAAPADVWKQVVDRAITHGNPTIEPTSKALIYTLKETSTDPVGDVVIREILLMAKPSLANRVDVFAVLLSFSEYKHLPGDAASADIWEFEVNPSGQLEKVTRFGNVTRGSSTVDTPPVLMDLADPETKRRFDETLHYWSER